MVHSTLPLTLSVSLSDLYMVLVGALDNRVSEESIVRWNVLPLVLRPIHVLLPPFIVMIIVHKAQNHLNHMLPSLR